MSIKEWAEKQRIKPGGAYQKNVKAAIFKSMKRRDIKVAAISAKCFDCCLTYDSICCRACDFYVPPIINSKLFQCGNSHYMYNLFQRFIDVKLGIRWPSRSFKNVYRGHRRRQCFKALRMSQNKSRITIHAAGASIKQYPPQKIKTICFDESINEGGE